MSSAGRVGGAAGVVAAFFLIQGYFQFSLADLDYTKAPWRALTISAGVVLFGGCVLGAVVGSFVFRQIPAQRQRLMLKYCLWGVVLLALCVGAEILLYARGAFIARP